MSTLTIYFPYTAVTGSGQQTDLVAPLAASLPIAPENNVGNLILTQQVGVFGPGAYQWVQSKGRWQFILPYTLICQQLFGVSQNYVVMPNAGDNLLQIGSSGAAIVSVYRNSYLLPEDAYSVVPQGITLVTSALNGDVFVVIQISPLLPTTDISSGGGIPEAPDDGTAYVRKNEGWEDIQNELNEGNYTGV
jgi:hypothetical protein